MKFYDYRDTWRAVSNLFDSREEMYEYISKTIDNPLALRHLTFERSWTNEGRPYYDVYPSIIGMLTKLNLNFPGIAISGEDGKKFSELTTNERIYIDASEYKYRKFHHLLIRLPETDNTLSFQNKGETIKVRTIFLSFQPVARAVGTIETTLGLVIGIDINETSEGVPIYTMLAFPLDDRPVENCIYSLLSHSSTYLGIQIPIEISTACVKLAITLCLLEDNPELIEPDVLSKDRHRIPTASEQLKQELIERARRKGKYGFLVGKTLEENIKRGEMIPHSRRPHPAIVWTETGRQVPKIVLRKGSIIHRKKITNVPTGYQEKEK